ncbi:MAG TPA: hypothetical protein VLA00_17475 [Xanthobacteraceae bacterium]|nr:hypothetical protein [Xanthobacteraceae bacterium]
MPSAIRDWPEAAWHEEAAWRENKNARAADSDIVGRHETGGRGDPPGFTVGAWARKATNGTGASRAGMTKPAAATKRIVPSDLPELLDREERNSARFWCL